jgi:hypothetical protein
MGNKSVLVKYLPLYALFLMSAFHISCGQNKTDLPKENTKSETKGIVTSPGPDERNIHSKYEYTDSLGKRLIIQNSFPKGERYTDPNGEVYGYAVFWTRIINEPDNPLELKIDFPVNSYEVPHLPGKYFKVLVPADTMTIDKFPLFNYGLADLESFLDNSIHKPSSVTRTINPKESSGFYIVILSLSVEGANGMLRTGLSLKGQDLFYWISIYTSTPAKSLINEKEINCGSINLKNLMLRNQQKSIYF